MSVSNAGKTNLGLNVGTMVALIIALIAGGVISADLYSIVLRLEKQSIANGDAVNQTITQLLDLQQTNNMRGNDTLFLFKAVLEELETSSNQSFANQEEFFKPYLNETFGKLYKALNITD